ncbi:MBOAT-domain-containing protein [Lindgomyces ingoldianus]|uniref:MBOAT-domain-containing protein n=1 Tax=Lindgomyces ingoldianus TaxID=673940 RepID=A0ACB6RHE5_9PLEO|nr:MBOAT-domain-containing protein [Lindgomyces ingoldianus]KAF2477742.1 MBOAT-domain-containing protein [Lindgomyces ingoldianus]
MAYALSGLSNHRNHGGSEDSWSPDSSPVVSDGEDTRTLKVPQARRAGNGGTRSTTEASTASMSSDSGIHLDSNGSRATGPIPGQKDRNGRRKSIQVIIEKSDKKGRYTLTTDDPEFREIMRSGIEREAAILNGKSRNRFRDLVFTRQFTTFDRQNPRGSQSPFHGFFTLFWLAMALLLLKIAAQNWKNQGSVFGRAEILHLMVDRDLFVLSLTDGAMALSTSFGFLLQKAIANNYLTWGGSGWVIQSLWEIFFVVSVISVSFYREWSWTHTVFIVLHVFVLLMKQHSYAFYNGYLSRVYRRRTLLGQKLEQLEEMDAQESPSPTSAEAQAVMASGLDDASQHTHMHHRRSIGPKYSTNFSKEHSEIASMAQAIEDGKPLNAEQIQAFNRVLKTEITILDEELRGKCTTSGNCYPKNLTLTNLIDWTCLPTLVYELEYPRQERINWWYVAEKAAATLGVIWIMIIISQAYLYPVVVEVVRQKEAGLTLDQRWKELPWVVSDMLFPLLLEQLLAWYVIWECLLNVLAELTCFADRGFYGDWWNSISWDQYARDWNRPVHNFLLRHVYHSSISAFHLSKMGATFVTFLLSAVVHEILMFCLFKKVRGYLFALQLSQIPLAAMSRTRIMKGRDTLGNIIFWMGLFIGPSLITSLYLIV